MKIIKRAFSFIAVLLSLTFVISCIDDQGKFEFIATEPSEDIGFTNTFLNEYVLTNQTLSNIAERFVWNTPSFGVETPVQYELQGAPGADFSDITTLGNTNQNQIAVTVAQMMALAGKAGLDNDPHNNEVIDGEIVPNNAGTIYFRVKASVGSQQNLQATSAVQAVNVFLPEPTGDDEEPSLPLIAVPGNHQGWSPESAPLLAASGPANTDYEGYVWLDGEYKFVAPNDDGLFQWGNLDWGDDGTFTGNLVADDEVNCNAETAGHYFVQANTSDLTYSITAYQWGVIGSATPGGWDTDTDMSFDPETGLWSVTMDLVGGMEIKFRANDAWDLNYGDEGPDGTLEPGGANIPIEESGNYTIILDLTSPRNYTYELTLN